MSGKILEELIDIFQPNGIDWLGDNISEDNPITYHHIVKKACGGRKSLDNGALLTKRSHKYLHSILEQKNYETYLKLNDCFKELNKTKQPPTNDYYINVHTILNGSTLTDPFEQTKTYKREMINHGKKM